MKAYSQAKDQIIIEEITDTGRTATFFSYGKKVATINTVNNYTITFADGTKTYPVRDEVTYDPAIAFYSKTTAKHFKKFVEDKVARSDVWYFIKQNEKVTDNSKNPDYGFLSILAKTL
jgi:hypothetical protein